MTKDIKEKKSRKGLYAVITLALMILTGFIWFRKSGDFWDDLTVYGVKSALTSSFYIPVLLAFSLIFALMFLFSSGASKRRKKKMMTALARQAAEAKRNGEEFEMPNISGSKVGSVAGGAAEFITKFVIAAFILCIIGFGFYGYLKVEEYNGRPEVNVLDAVDVGDLVKGYDGLGYLDNSEIGNSLPSDITEILKTGKNYKASQDYTSEQAVWSQVLITLAYNVEADSADTASLSNGDKITISVELPGYDIPKLNSTLGINLTGLDEKKEITVEGLPYKYKNASEVADEQSDFINAGVELLRKKANEQYGDFKSSKYGDFIFDGVYLAKPNYNENANPDALIIMAHVNTYVYTDYSSCDTMVLYAYPFDSNTKAADIEKDKGYSDGEGMYVNVEFFEYNQPSKVLSAFETGIYFSGNTAYRLEQISYSEGGDGSGAGSGDASVDGSGDASGTASVDGSGDASGAESGDADAPAETTEEP